MIKKEPYDSPKLSIKEFPRKDNVNTTLNDVITISNDVYEDDPFDI